MYRALPTTRYQGSKRKLVQWIHSCLGDRPIPSLLDVMGGSGTVGYYFKAYGARVFSNDYLVSNYMTALALIENDDTILTDDDLAFLLSSPSQTPGYQFVQENFGGLYYLDDENRWIDERICRIDQLSDHYSEQTLQRKRALAFHNLCQAALMKRPFNLFHRKNLNLRTARVQRKFGNKTTWDTPFPVLFLRLSQQTNHAVFCNGLDNIAYNELAELVEVAASPSVVYLDPPYFGSDRDRAQSDYRFLYHFLEGLTQYQRWPEFIDKSDVRLTLQRNYNELSPYIVPSQRLSEVLLSQFRSILSRWPNSTLVLSYKSPGVPSKDELVALMGELRSRIQVHQRSYTYALNKKNGHPHENIELLIIGD